MEGPLTGTAHFVPACPALSRCAGIVGFVPPCPACPGIEQGSDNAWKYADKPLVPADRDEGCTAYGGPDRRRERGSPRRGGPLPARDTPGTGGLSRYRIDHPGSRRDLALVQRLRKCQRFGAQFALHPQCHRNLKSLWRVLPGIGLYGGYSRPVTFKRQISQPCADGVVVVVPSGTGRATVSPAESEEHHVR